jgi:hypothetical protein
MASSKRKINYDLGIVDFAAQFGYDVSEATKRELLNLLLAVECADWEIHGTESQKPSIFSVDDDCLFDDAYACMAAYVGSCIENNYNQ